MIHSFVVSRFRRLPGPVKPGDENSGGEVSFSSFIFVKILADIGVVEYVQSVPRKIVMVILKHFQKHILNSNMQYASNFSRTGLRIRSKLPLQKHDRMCKSFD